MNKKIFIRNEIFENEYRTPLVPSDIKELIENGKCVYVQKSNTRCHSDEEFENNGAILTDNNWKDHTDCLILGIKELDFIDDMKQSEHMYFAHCYKGQDESEEILRSFKNSSSILYDLEYLLDKNDKRLVSFSYHAGVSGGILGLLQYQENKMYNKNIKNLYPWESAVKKMKEINYHFNNKNICVIGSNGRCGQGVRFVLDSLNIKYQVFNSKDKINELLDYDIIYNCIHLRDKMSELITKDSKLKQKTLLVDISCDYNNPLNPFPVYSQKTTWEEPILKINDLLDVISIDNLPSLIPFESSEYFSCILKNIMNKNDKLVWDKAYKYYKKNIELI
jgi:saccharopine dehydrogenase (NAD+, L-lysine-forming)